ncbi:DUF1372 family protein [Streptococcus oralis]|uniref:DUF1372 family protein n=1 Tax=Streptococcus oralis TaxID=1303 RepID=UPI002285396F|nr:DUF1372 family protein [Streptococcus oralis]MCY7111037.1 DUF1372 family protein [Streptococcus oralis]
MKRFIALWIVLSAGLNIWQSIHIKKLEAKRPIVIYKADNAGAEIDGKITNKEIIEGRYTVTVDAYGRFLVTKAQYESLAVGDEIPDFLKKWGS